MQVTNKRFETEPFLREFDALVLDCTPAADGWDVVLDATAFYPEGGGQPCDVGTLNGIAVQSVHNRDGVITHRTAAPLEVGTAAHGVLDWARRFDHMQQHTGEHILSGTLHRLFGAENVGFHIGSPFVRMDMSVPLSADQLAQAEAEANAVVQADVAVRCWVPQPEELAALPYRSKKELEGDIRLVEVPGADLCACCGTHVERTGQVGLIKILTAQNYKGGTRLAVQCGSRAFATLAAEHSDALAAGTLLSSAPGVLAAAVKQLLDAQAADRQRIAALQNGLADALAAAAQPGAPALFCVDGTNRDGMRRICTTIAAKTEAPTAVLSPLGGTEFAYAITAPGRDVRPLCKALNAAFAGRGGGNAAVCQGTLTGTADAVRDLFLFTITNHQE